ERTGSASAGRGIDRSLAPPHPDASERAIKWLPLLTAEPEPSNSRSAQRTTYGLHHSAVVALDAILLYSRAIRGVRAPTRLNASDRIPCLTESPTNTDV